MTPLPATMLNRVIHADPQLWEPLRGRQVLLTGATGFFGTWLVESLLAADAAFELGVTAHVLTRDVSRVKARSPHLAAHPALQWQEGDIRRFDPAGLDTPFVIHAATEASAALNADHGHVMLETIIDGTRRALDVARSRHAERFLFVSSGAVYGPQPSSITHVTEDYLGGPDPTAPGSAYAEGKRAAELFCALEPQSSGMIIPIARCFAFVGPHLPLDRHFAVGNFIRDGLAGGPIRVNGDGTPRRSYMHASDLALWLWTMLLRGEGGRAYNVGSEEDLSIRELAERVASAFERPFSVEVAQPAVAGAPVARYVPSTHRARTELGLTPGLDLDAALAQTIAWHQSQREVARG